jgi:hypothetical protein
MKRQKYEIIDTGYFLQTEPDGSTLVKIQYYVKFRDGEKIRKFSEYLNFEDAKLKKRAAHWWKIHSYDPIPETNQHAVDIMNYHGVDILAAIEIEYTGTGYEVANVTIKENAKRLEEIW